MCHCGEWVEPTGRHDFSCRRSAGRILRHSSINSIIVQALKSVEISSQVGALRTFRIRPQETGRGYPRTLGTWQMPHRGLHLPGDCGPVAPISSIAAGSAAQEAEVRKTVKYAGLVSAYIFFPVVLETVGAWG